MSLQASEEPVNVDGSSFGISVPAGGARVFLATSLTPNQVRTGWARFESATSGVTGLSTFLLADGLTLRSVAGVFASQPVEFATIGVDNSLLQSRFTGFSIANPTNENMNVRLVVLNAEGNITETISPPELNPLGPGRQVSKFLHEYLPARSTFRGSTGPGSPGRKKIRGHRLDSIPGAVDGNTGDPGQACGRYQLGGHGSHKRRSTWM